MAYIPGVGKLMLSTVNGQSGLGGITALICPPKGTKSSITKMPKTRHENFDNVTSKL